MLRWMIIVSMLGLIDGLINISSQPEKVINGDPVKLVCDVGTMKDTVKWVYGGVTYFSCDPPYTNCYINTKYPNNGIYDFSVNNYSLIVLLFVNQNQNNGAWSCYHGNDKADIEIDHADAPKITYFRSSSVDEETSYLFRCNIESQVPADVVIYSHSYLGVRTLYEMKQTSIKQHNITTNLLCSDYRIYCNVSNGYGPAISEYTTVSKKCPLKILQALSPNSTLTFSETFWYTSLELKVYYEGYPKPTHSLHHFSPASFQEVTEDVRIYQYYPTSNKPAYFRVTFEDLDESDVGKYVLTLKQGKEEPVVQKEIITLVYTGITSTRPPATTIRGQTKPPTTTTITRGPTQPPTTTTTIRGQTRPPTRITTRGSTSARATTRDLNQSFSNATRARRPKQPPTIITSTTPKSTSTNQSETKDEREIMVYLGVAGFVMTLLLVLFQFIICVFWFNRIRRKPAGSVDQANDLVYLVDIKYPNTLKSNHQQWAMVYSTPVQTPSNSPSHIYEDLKK